jgi:hypothetical protein
MSAKTASESDFKKAISLEECSLNICNSKTFSLLCRLAIITNTPSREKNREIVILAEKRTQKFVILAAFCSK